MTRELSIDEQVVADGYRQSAREAELRAEKLTWAAGAIQVLLDPRLSQATRDEVYAMISARQDDEPVKLDGLVRLHVQENLGRAAGYLSSLQVSAFASAETAEDMARRVEQVGLPEVSE